MLNKCEFEVLYEIHKNRSKINSNTSQENYYNKTIENLYEKGMLLEGEITQNGEKELEKYKVDNAIIMAAGLSSRFAPLSYENPKGLLKVKGEVLVERQINQLREAGIDNIILVTGYMKEKYEYLREKFNIEIYENLEYKSRNNNSTLYLVRERLKNSYICSSDNYFVKNVFESHVYDSFYSVVFEHGKTNEYCVSTDKEGKIINVKIGGEDSLTMMGHVYFSNDFSARFVKILEEVYKELDTYGKLWEDIYIENLDKLSMFVKEYEKGEVLEFDYLEDLRAFDNSYINNSRSQIIKNICKVLHCGEGDVTKIIPLKKGSTNTSFIFNVNDNRYVYRHTGVGTESTINRKSEAYSQKIEKAVGLDENFIYMDKSEGWKISKFIDNCNDFDYGNTNHVKKELD